MIGAIPKGLFGRGMRGAIGGAIGEASLTMPMPQQAPEPPKSFWQGGGKFTGKDAIAGALAAIGDGLSNWSNGGGNTATGALLEGRMRPELERQRMAQEAAKQAQEIAAYRTKKGIDAEFNRPEMDEFDKAMTRGGIQIGSPEYNRFAREYAERKAMGPDPLLQGAPLPGGGTYTGPFSGYSGMASGRPITQSDWDSAKPVGGAGSNASGSFRP